MKNLKDAIVTLRQGRAGFTVCPLAGGVITRYWHELDDGSARDWLWPASTDAIGQRDPLGMSCFPLVPFSGRIRDSRFQFQGQTVKLTMNFLPQRHAIHGHGWKQPWQLLEQTANKLIIEYRHNADEWPWDYSSRQTFELSEQGLKATIDVRNESAKAMPAGIGFHPYYVRTPKAKVTAEFDKIWLNDDEVMPVELVAAPAERDLRKGLVMEQIALDNTFTGWNRRALIEWPEWNASLLLEAEAPLDNLVVYSPPGQKFFCVEPVSNVADAFNMADQGQPGSGVRILEAGETLAATARFTPNSK
jgi:aldose 1-epimerase